MIIREGQRKVIMPDRIGVPERDSRILCTGKERETPIAGAPSTTRKTANPRNYLEVSCFRLTRAFETSGINSVPYYRSDFTRSKEGPAAIGKLLRCYGKLLERINFRAIHFPDTSTFSRFTVVFLKILLFMPTFIIIFI